MIKISGFTDEVSSKLSEQIALVKELKQGYICPRSLNGKNISDYSPEEFEREILPVLRENQIGISSIGSSVGKVGLYDENGFNAQLEKLKNLVAIARLCDCKFIRIFSFYVDGKGDYGGYFDETVKKLKKMVETVEGTDIVLIHENEKKIFGDTPERCLALYRAVNHPNFKLAFDASNYIQCGAEPFKAYLMLKDCTAYYHVKDCSPEKVEVPLGMGGGKYDEIIADLIKSGYDGFLTLEPHTFKYALLKRSSYALYPLFKLIGETKNFAKVFRRIDREYNIPPFKKVSRKEVYVWQYEKLKEYLIKENLK